MDYFDLHYAYCLKQEDGLSITLVQKVCLLGCKLKLGSVNKNVNFEKVNFFFF